MDLSSFQQKYGPRDPALPGLAHELLLLSADHGVRALQKAPVDSVSFGRPPRSREDKGESRYLWVIDDQGIPYIMEQPLKYLGGRVPKHTNLTGGAVAYLGGEIWFNTSINLVLSGGSGRYPPLHETQLNDAAQVFESYGYQVVSLGWNAETDKAERIYRVL